jgi:CubicO group peptidase (beta-lactamase class C family)
MKRCLVLATALLMVVCTFAQPVFYADSNRLEKIAGAYAVIDNMMKDYAVKSHYPGLVWGLVVDGKLVHTGGSGYTDLAKKTVAGSKSVFRIASMSKSFTAMAILKLRDEGKLDLDDPAYKYIPQMKGLKYPSTDSRAITVRDLLTHAAGFPEDNPWGDRQLADTDQELMQLVQKGISFSTSPGTAYEYSNLGFALLGRIISNVSKMPYQQYITQQILKPLGMTHTYYEYTKVPAKDLAHGYRWINENWREEALEHDGSYGAMGGMLTTIEDFAKYVAFHQSAWPPNNAPDNGPIKRSSLREMQHPWNYPSLNANNRLPSGKVCPTVSSYAYGLSWTKDCENTVSVGHSGGLPGFGSQWKFLPDYGIGVISFANVTYAGTGNVNNLVTDTILRLTGLKPAMVKPSAILEQRKNQLAALLPDWKGAESSGIFAENFFPDNPVDSLRKESKDLFEKAGKISSISTMQSANQLRGIFTMYGENGNVDVFFTLTPETNPLIQQYRTRFVPKKK